MKVHTCKRAISLLIALVMVVLSLPFATMTVVADDGRVITNFNERGSLGNGVNFLSGSPLRDAIAKDFIFRNDDAPVSDAFHATEQLINQKRVMFTHVTDAGKYLTNNTNSTSIGIGVKAQMYMVTLEMQSKFGFEETSAYEKNTTMEYAHLSVVSRYKHKYLDTTGTHINDFWEQDEDGNYKTLSRLFVHDVENIASLGKTLDEAYAEFFGKYGTHILTQYTSGAEAYLTYSGDNLSEKTTGSTSWNSNVTVKGSVSEFLDMSVELEDKGSSSDENYTTIDGVTIDGECYGGEGLVTPTTIMNMLRGGDDSVDSWVRTVNDGNDVVVFDDNITGEADSLRMMPIWALLVKPEHQALRIELERYFNEHVDTQFAELYEKYIYNPTISEKDYSDYTLITSAEEFKQIREDLNGMYVLCCDIDLGGKEWEPIGTAEEPFTGILDGNGATVKGLSVTATKDGAAGLFGYNEGTIRDLNVVGTINVTDTDHENKAAYIGGIVGHNAGTVSGCQNNVSIVSSLDTQTGATTVTEEVSLADKVDFNLDIDAVIEKYGEDAVKSIDLSTNNQPGWILDGVHIVKVTGTENSSFVFHWDVGSGEPLYIILEDAYLRGTIFSRTTRDVVIISKGTSNTIQGHFCKDVRTNGYDETCAAIHLPYANVYLIGDAELNVIGENGDDGGVNGKEGTDGKSGKRAIWCSSLNIDLNNEIKLTGGNGGNGGNGKKGNDGYAHGAYENRQSVAASGAPGGNGGNGGIGARPIAVENDIITYAGKLLLQSGAGGNGGNGGQGGRGGDGVDGHTKLEYYPEIGGDGGTGGRGGDAGGVAFCSYNILCYNDASVVINNHVTNGRGGDGGKGGDGGQGGDGYHSSAFHVAKPPHNGLHGARGGNAGRGGDGGDGFSPGTAGSAGTPGNGGAGGSYSWFGAKHGDSGDPGISLGKGNPGSTILPRNPLVTYTTSDKLYQMFNESVTYESAQTQKGGLIDNSVFATGAQNGAISPYFGNKSSLEVVKGNNPASSEYSYILKVTSAYGEHSVHHGGYRHTLTGNYGETYYIAFLAKIPVGYRIELQNNHLGTGGYNKILSSDQGTGEWQWYYGLWHYGSSGDLNTCGYIAIDGGGLKEGETVDWYLAYTNMYRGFNPEFTSLISIGSEEEQQIANELLSMTTQKHVYIGLERVPGRPNWWQWADGNQMYVPSLVDCSSSGGKYIYGECYDINDNTVFSNWDTAHNEPNNEIENVGMLWGAGDSEHELGTWNDTTSISLLDGYITETKIGQAPAIDPTCNGVYAGGIVGYNAFGGKVEKCINHADVTVDKAVSTDGAINAVASGIVGINSGKVNDCCNTGNIKAYASSNSIAAWAQAYADQIAYSLTDGSVEGAVLSDVTCDALSNTVSDLDNDNHGTGVATASETISENVQANLAYWARHEIGLTFNHPAEGDEDMRLPVEYVVDEELRKQTLNVTVDGKTLVNYNTFYSFLKPGTRVVTISFENGGRSYERSFPVRVLDEKLPCKHDGNKLDMPAVAPDCDEVGYTEGVFCLLCFTYISGHEEVPATGAHVDADGVWEHNENEHYHVCACGAEFDFVPHSTTTANCVTNATCDVCGTEYGGVDSSIHVNTEVRGAVTPTCAEDGYTGDTYCADCGTFLASGKTIPATGDHVDADGLWESNGKNHYHTCACGTRFDAEAHFGGEATCSEKAYCEVCDTDYGSLDPDNHVNTTVKNVSEPTCTENGYTGDRVCLNCGTVLEKGETIPAWEHTYDDGTVTTAPTCSATGVKTFVCATCRHSYTETIPALGHDTVSHDAQAPTCTEIGWDAYETCTRCDYTTYAELSALGHDTVRHDAQAPTCTEIGWDAYETCARCDYTTYAELSALGHDYVNGKCMQCGDSLFSYGDSTGDGKIDGKDATRLLQYLANYNPFTGESTVAITAGGDVNGDGKIDGKDATRLLQYLANYNPFTGESDVVLGPAN